MALVVKNLSANAGEAREVCSIPGSGDPLGEEMATHSSILGWRIPWREQPGGLQSVASQRIVHNWSDLAHMHQAGDTGSIPGSGRSPGEGNSNHSGILAWKIPWVEKPSGLCPWGHTRVGHSLPTKQQ